MAERDGTGRRRLRSSQPRRSNEREVPCTLLGERGKGRVGEWSPTTIAGEVTRLVGTVVERNFEALQNRCTRVLSAEDNARRGQFPFARQVATLFGGVRLDTRREMRRWLTSETSSRFRWVESVRYSEAAPIFKLVMILR